jgi:predicted RecB family nuclease
MGSTHSAIIMTQTITTPITAAMLYDYVQCPHRVAMDLFEDVKLKDDVSPFVQLLWDKGSLYEKEVIRNLAIPFTDLSQYGLDEKEQKTAEAMDRKDQLIYGGRIRAVDLLGDPDLLRFENGSYIAGDIKSGAGQEGGDDDEDPAKPKVHYAVQLAVYTDILKQLGRSSEDRAFVWDIHGDEVAYNFLEVYGKRNPHTLWQDYQEAIAEVRQIVGRTVETLGAYSATCKDCVWYTTCLKRLSESDDLTLIPGLGRSKRDVLIDSIQSIAALAEANPAGYINGKKTIFKGIGPDSLEKFIARARLITNNGKPYLRQPVTLPVAPRELFFDIEVDPMRDICYLHGFVERNHGDTEAEKFVAFFADEETPESEEKAFRGAWEYIKASQPAAIFYYSKYERTLYRKLRQKFPHVCSEGDIEELFASPMTVDLYFDVVLKATEWATRDYSLKTLAKYLGFAWRDTHPSGAASIEWFDRWVKTRDDAVRERILLYNEDDCRATRVLLDGIRAL